MMLLLCVECEGRGGGGTWSCEFVEMRVFDALVFSLCVYVCGLANNIGAAGGSALGAALVTNSTLTELRLGGECDVLCVMMWLCVGRAARRRRRGCECGDEGV